MRIYPWKSGAAILSSIAAVALITGCQTQPKQQIPKAPSNIPKGTLTVAGDFAAYVYLDGQWKVLKGNSVKDQPSATFHSIEFAPNGKLMFTTDGSNDDALEGNEIQLWRYSNGWQQASINGDENITKSAWSPQGNLYAVPDDGQTNGIWYANHSSWHVVPGSASLGFIDSISWSPQGTLTVISEASDGSSAVWQDVGGKWRRLNTSSVPFASDGLQVEWSPKGVLTLATSAHGVWEYVHGSWVQAGGINSPIANVMQVGWSPQGNLVISGSTAKSTGIWELFGGKWSPIGGADSPIMKDAIRQFGWSPAGVLTVSDARTGKIVQLKANKWVDIWDKSPNSSVPPTFQWSPSGVLTATGGSVGGLWQYQNGQWAQVGGNKSPVHGEQGLVFGWSE